MKRTLKEVQAHPISLAINPKGKQFLQAFFLPPVLNPYVNACIEIAALVPYGIPHLKTIPTWQMMYEDFENGLYDDKHTIVVPSSGNTVHTVALLATVFGFKKVKAIMATDVPGSKSDLLRAFGALVDVMQVSDVVGTALTEASKPGHYLLDQYSHMGNVRAHEMYTGPEILRVVGDRIAAIAVAMGSAGTVTGVSHCLKKSAQKTLILGVRPKGREQVPGARNADKMSEVVKFAWRDAVDDVQEVSRKWSFVRTRHLWSAVPQPGPTSGMAFAGLVEYFEKSTPEFRASCRGTVACFLCHDDGRFYSAPMLAELDPDQGIVE